MHRAATFAILSALFLSVVPNASAQSIAENHTISILGEVKRPGTYTISANMSVAELLELAGGVVPTAASEVIVIQRTNDTATMPRDYDAMRLLIRRGGAPGLKVTHFDLKHLLALAHKKLGLQTGDRVVVPSLIGF